jgi:hypothetical protein
MAGGTVVFAAGLAPANPVDSTVIINLNVKSTDAIAHRVHTEGHRPLSGVHSIMMEKLTHAGEGGGCTPTPLSPAFTITFKVAVYAPAKWADILTLFHLYQYVHSLV